MSTNTELLMADAGKTPICVWPDGEWCYQESIEDYGWKSDDYVIMYVPIELDFESVDEIAAGLVEA